MSDLEKFSSKATKKHSNDIFGVIKDMFSLGIKEFSRSISYIFQTPSGVSGAKNQISNRLSKWEKRLADSRKFGS